VRFNTISINSALANVFTSITARPKILRISVSVVPPRKVHTVELQRSADAIVLIDSRNKLEIRFYFFTNDYVKIPLLTDDIQKTIQSAMRFVC
jgi:hypothetical protein